MQGLELLDRRQIFALLVCDEEAVAVDHRGPGVECVGLAVVPMVLGARTRKPGS